jgi:hypothetical protein
MTFRRNWSADDFVSLSQVCSIIGRRRRCHHGPRCLRRAKEGLGVDRRGALLLVELLNPFVVVR